MGLYPRLLLKANLFQDDLVGFNIILDINDNEKSTAGVARNQLTILFDLSFSHMQIWKSTNQEKDVWEADQSDESAISRYRSTKIRKRLKVWKTSLQKFPKLVDCWKEIWFGETFTPSNSEVETVK